MPTSLPDELASCKTIAIIPARGGSKGLPRKNIKSLLDLPLLGWPVKAAKASSLISRTIVSTEDEEIAEVARTCGAEVPFLRPCELATDTAGTEDVLLHIFAELDKRQEQFDYCVLLEPTSPLTDTMDIDGALRALHQNRRHADSILGVCQAVTHHPAFCMRLKSGNVLEPLQPELFSRGIRRQDLEELYFLDGSLYIFNVEAFKQTKRIRTERSMAYVMPKWKSLEIDDYQDFICIEAILKNKEKMNE